MPAYIPYSHPSLQIGHAVTPALLNLFKQMNNLQQQIDVAHDKLNSLVMMKRSMTMTANELSDMQINTNNIETAMEEVNKKIVDAATDYMAKRIANENTIQITSEEMQGMDISLADAESIIDFAASKYEARPFASDSLNLDSQFFSFGSNMQDDMIANIEKFVRNSTSQTPGVAEQTAKAVSSQLMNQVQNHSISGTLIIVASCRHRNIGIFNPLVIDPDKAVQVWNALHPNNKIDSTADLSKVQDDGADSLSIITGATYGSSFVGMVHILKSDKMQMDDYEKLKAQVDGKLKLGSWLANATGGFGVNEEALKDIRAIISSKSVNSHVSIITVGAMASLKANTMFNITKDATDVKDEIIQRTLNLGGENDKNTLDTEAKEAKQIARMVNLENARISQIMEKVHVLDEKSNNTLNISSLMTAFANYLETIGEKNAIVGTPIGFSVRKLTKGDIVRLLMRK